MSRAECFSVLKSDKGMQEACKIKYGRNYTQVSTNDLITLIESSKEPSKKAHKCEEVVDTIVRAAISKLVDFLEDNGTIEYDEKEEIINILGGKAVVASTTEDYKPKSVSPYSDDEIDEMFACINR
jgi:hypothetical protein